MTGESLIAFFFFWGIWLLVPMLVDGTGVLTQLVGVWTSEWKNRRKGMTRGDLKTFPRVSLIIPVHNGGRSLGKTLKSLCDQTYPLRQMEVIVVDNGSTDNTERMFWEHQWQNPLGALHWISTPNPGKAWALNAGIYFATGDYVSNVGCDVALHPDAVLNMVKAFENDPNLSAATGAIEISPDSSEGNSAILHAARECEFVEYFSAFRIGRQSQTLMNSIFTLAGAFSFFRREILLELPQYSDRTVSEDTDITFSLRERFPETVIACLNQAIAYVEPFSSFSALYSQRVRWQRGEIEVAACNPHLLTKNLFRINGVSPVKTLVVDHTLAFPRVVWTFLLPMLFLFGYPLSLVTAAAIAMYLCYMTVDAMIMANCYVLGHKEARSRLRKCWWLFTVLPMYRFILFWFRLGGFLAVLNEPPQWRTSPPWQEAAKHGSRLISQSYIFACQLGSNLTTRPSVFFTAVLGFLAFLAKALGMR